MNDAQSIEFQIDRAYKAECRVKELEAEISYAMKNMENFRQEGIKDHTRLSKAVEALKKINNDSCEYCENMDKDHICGSGRARQVLKEIKEKNEN